MRLPGILHSRYVQDTIATFPRPQPRSGLWLLLLSLLVAAVCYYISDQFGLAMLLTLVTVLSVGSIFFAFSWKWPQVALLVWLMTLLGLRHLFYLPTPGLPDLTLDRMAMLWIFAVFLIKTVAEKRKLKGPFTLDWLLVLHGTYLILSIVMMNSVAWNSWTRSYLMPYAAFMMGKYLMNDVVWIKRAFFILMMTNVYFAFTSIAEGLDLDALVWPKTILNHDLGMYAPGRSRGIFLQPAVNGTVIGMLLCIQLYFLREARHGYQKVLMLVTIAMSAVGLYFTYTRGTWLSGAVGLVALALISWRHYSAWVIRLALVGVVLLGLGFVNLSQDKFFRERWGAEHTLTGRLNTAATAFRIWLANPIFGVGFKNYQYVKHEYMQTINVPIFGTIRRGQGFESSPHDIYLGSLCEEGLVGMGMQMTIYFLIARAFLRKYRWRREGDHFSVYILPVIGAMFISYFIGGLTFDYRYFASLAGIFYFIAGIMYGYQHGGGNAWAPPPARTPSLPQPTPALRT